MCTWEEPKLLPFSSLMSIIRVSLPLRSTPVLRTIRLTGVYYSNILFFYFTKYGVLRIVDRQKDEKRAKLIQTAIETIRLQGIRKTTLEDIAVAAGMAPPSMYYYFANKNDFLRAAVGALLDKAFNEVEKAVDLSATPEQKLISTWKVLFAEAQRSGFLLDPNRKARSQLMEISNDFVNDFNARYSKLIGRILSEGCKQGVFMVDDLEVTASLLSTGVWGILLNTVNQTPAIATEVWLDEWGKLLMNGLKAR